VEIPTSEEWHVKVPLGVTRQKNKDSINSPSSQQNEGSTNRTLATEDIEENI
jgi:hypothetical protein